mmetsp:Transcript_8710/g.9761  ORF Transcript_8710/g.9761 Transcript_8710/m.9761 type:complete len:85 (-) Transcript_8710:99-353(-)
MRFAAASGPGTRGTHFFLAGVTATNATRYRFVLLPRARGSVSSSNALSWKETVAKAGPEGHGHRQHKVSEKGCQQRLLTLMNCC